MTIQHRGSWFVFTCLATVAACGSSAHGEDAAPANKVSFFRDIRPILQDRCQGCHQPAKPQGGLVLTTYGDLREGGESEEAAIVPGKPQESELYKQITVSQITAAEGEKPSMPKDADPLPKHQIELIARWITEGAVDDTPASTKAEIDMEHPPQYTAAPAITSLDFSPDGKLLAVSGYHEVLLHRIDNEPGDRTQLVARLVGLSERIESAVFSPDGKKLAVTGGSPGRFGEVQVWNVAKKKLLLSVPVTYDTIYGASWSSDGAKIAFACADNTVRAIDANTGKQILYQGAHADWASTPSSRKTTRIW